MMFYIVLWGFSGCFISFLLGSHHRFLDFWIETDAFLVTSFVETLVSPVVIDSS